jgi:hypothetical protein
MLVFLLTQAKSHFKHHSTVGETYLVLVFLLVQEKTHFKQHHSTVGEN